MMGTKRLVRELARQLCQQFIGTHDINPKIGDELGREVTPIVGADEIRLRSNRGGEHVKIGRVGELHPLDDSLGILVAFHPRQRKRSVKRGDEACCRELINRSCFVHKIASQF